MALPAVSPYWFPAWVQESFRRQLAQLVPEDEFERLVPEGPLVTKSDRPLLLVSAVDVLNGEFMVFSSDGPKPHSSP